MTTYTTWNPSDKSSTVTLSNGNLTATWTGASNNTGVRAAGGALAGKYYFELTTGSLISTGEGVATGAAPYGSSPSPAGSAVITYGGTISINGTSSGVSLGTVSGGTTIGIAVDFTNQMIWFRKAPSGNWNANASYNPATNTGGLSISSITSSGTVALFPATFTTAGASNTLANFGPSGFSGTVPSGFTSGWSAPTINAWTASIASSAGAVASVRATAASRAIASIGAVVTANAVAASRAIASIGAVVTANAAAVTRAASTSSAAFSVASRFLPLGLATAGALGLTRAVTKARSATTTSAARLARVVVMNARSIAATGTLRMVRAIPRALSATTGSTLWWARVVSSVHPSGIAGTLSATKSATRGLLAATAGALAVCRGTIKAHSVAILSTPSAAMYSLKSLAASASAALAAGRVIGKLPAAAVSGALSSRRSSARGLVAGTRSTLAAAAHATRVRLIAISIVSSASELAHATKPVMAQIVTGSVIALSVLSTIGRVSLELLGRGGALILSALGRRNR